MAYIKKKSERKFKITVCNGYKVNGQKRMKAQTITVPSSVPKRGIQQYVMAEAERIEKKFKYGVEESDQTHFDQYAENWLKRQELFFKGYHLRRVQTQSGYCLPVDWWYSACKVASHDPRGNVRGTAQAPGAWWKLHQGNYCAEISGNCFLGAGRCQEK